MPPGFANSILASLREEDLKLLAPLRPADFPKRKYLEPSHQRIETVYFFESGLGSAVARGTEGREVEVGMMGRDGMTGTAVILGAGWTPTETFIQVEGQGFSVPASRLSEAMDISKPLRKALLNYCHVYMVQAAHTALSNAKNTIEERLARWLLMTDDRLTGGLLPLTHDYLAMMMGVRRAGVSTALEKFSMCGLVETGRGVIRILDRDALTAMCHGTYLRPGECRPYLCRAPETFARRNGS